MNLLIKKATIIDSSSPHNGKTMDILIENGIITLIQADIKAEKKIKIFEAENLHISQGWLDMQSNFCDPGFEYKENLESGIKAAITGGYTAVVLSPNTYPVVDCKQAVEYIKSKTTQAPLNVYPTGTISQHLAGKDISEMYDMHLAGAVGFSDEKKPIADAGLLLRALLYVKTFNGLIITHCDEQSISQDGQMNESITSTTLGLKGMPALAEELMIARNIQLAEYTNSRLHISSVSTTNAVNLIRQAKAKGLSITAATNAYSIALDDSCLNDFDTNYKVNPPLRSKFDIQALKKGLLDGTIDVICSDHNPENEENKKLEFDYAAFGIIALETAFATANTHKGKLKLEQLIYKITEAPRKILNLPVFSITEGAVAECTFFNPDKEWIFTEKHIVSKSKNTPFIGIKFKGKAIATYVKKSFQEA